MIIIIQQQKNNMFKKKVKETYILQDGEHAVRGGGVETGSGLVKKQNRRVRHQFKPCHVHFIINVCN